MDTHGADTSHVLHWARAYDILAKVVTLGQEGKLRQGFVRLARLTPGECVLDVGCGTGTLALAARERVGPGGQVCGVDPSPEMVARARAKAAKAGADVRFEVGGIEALPFPDGSFDAVLSTLMLHHLSEEGRRQGIAEVARVLKPGGRLLAVDIGGGHGGGRHFALVHRLMPRHGDFDLASLAPVLDTAGFRTVDQGPVDSLRLVGLSNLRFVLAGTAAA